MLFKIKILRSQNICSYLAGPEDSDSAPAAGNSLRARIVPWQELGAVGESWDGLKAAQLPSTTPNVIDYSDIV